MIVSASSLIAAATVSIPTGPPSNLSMIVVSTSRSESSSPRPSTSSLPSASSDMPDVITLSPTTCA